MRYQRDGFSVEAAFRKGRPPPPWYLECPDLLQGEDVYLQDFNDLTTERQIAQGGVGPIPSSAIHRRAKEREFDDRVTYIYKYVIRDMDNGYMEWMRKDQERSQRQSMRKSKNG